MDAYWNAYEKAWMNIKQTLSFTLQLTAGNYCAAKLHPASISPDSLNLQSQCISLLPVCICVKLTPIGWKIRPSTSWLTCEVKLPSRSCEQSKRQWECIMCVWHKNKWPVGRDNQQDRGQDRSARKKNLPGKASKTDFPNTLSICLCS